MNNEQLRHKWDTRYAISAAGAMPPAAVLRKNEHLLPNHGTALDLACGLGGNAIFLARLGLAVHAWDLSPVAIERLTQTARLEGVEVEAAVRDVLAEPPAASSFDLISVTRFLDRALAPHLVAALRPGGLLLFQTFTRARVAAVGPNNEAFCLAENELLQMFAGLRILAYREEGTVGDPERGFRNEAMLVGQKRPD